MKRILLIIGIVSLGLSLVSCTKKTITTTEIETTTRKTTLENGNYVTDGFEYRPLNGNIAAIHSYKGTESNIIIPDKLDEFTVEYIDDLAFTNLSFVTSITLPKGLLEIGHNSFSYNENLTAINIPDDCSLNLIGANSFRNNPKLTSFTITSKVEIIRDRVFYGSGITSFEVKNNSRFSFINDLLIAWHRQDYGDAIFASPIKEDFVCPTNVKQLGNALFENNKVIKSINLNDVEFIGYDCFVNSSLETITGGDKLYGIGGEILDNTPWLLSKKDEDFVFLSTVLIRVNCNNKETIIIPDEITEISPNLLNSNTVKTIVLPETIEDINSEAFEKCPNLETIIIKATVALFYSGSTLSSKVKIYVPYTSLNTYKNNIFYTDVKNQIYPKEITVTFNDIDNNKVGEAKTYYYYYVGENYVEPAKIDGKTFKYYVDQNGNQIDKFTLIDSYEDIILTPVYE